VGKGMAMDKKELNKFIDSIPDLCRGERARFFSGGGSWDFCARKAFAEVLPKWFCPTLNIPADKVRDYVYVEGWNSIPKGKRGKPFFGTKMHPDAAIISGGGFSIAIELDHGAKGSQVRNALAKASFSVLLGKFDRVVLLFFWEGKTQMEKTDRLGADDKILKRFRELFQTTLYII
jgi:hypothetical protein